MELATILLADYANIEQHGKLNVMGIFGNIYCEKFPARHLSMTLIVRLRAELGEFGDDRQVNVKLLDEDGKEIIPTISVFVKIPEPSKGIRPEINLILQLNEIIFPKEGRYEIRVFIDKDSKGYLPIDVIQFKQKTTNQ